jgi:hypothetical protein
MTKDKPIRVTYLGGWYEPIPPGQFPFWAGSYLAYDGVNKLKWPSLALAQEWIRARWDYAHER